MIVLDEPTAGLDPKGRDEILDLVAELHRVRKITVVLVSHSMEDVAKYVDRLIVMDDGKVRFDGTPREVFSHYKELEKLGLAGTTGHLCDPCIKRKGLGYRHRCHDCGRSEECNIKSSEAPVKKYGI